MLYKSRGDEMRGIHFVLFFLVLLLFGCSSVEEIETRTVTLHEKKYEANFIISDDDEYVKISPSLLNTSEHSFDIIYGTKVVNIIVDNEPLEKGYRLPAYPATVYSSFEFAPVKIDKKVWTQATEISAEIAFELDGIDILKSVRLK